MSVSALSSTNAAAPLIERDRLQRACQEFEGLFLGLLMREMQATVPQSGFLALGTAGETFQSLWGQEVGRAAARSSPLGIADLLMKSLSRGVTPSAQAR